MESAPAIGIDLGTTNSCVAVMRFGKVEIIANELGNYVTPSYVSFTEHELFVGDVAKNQTAANPKNTLYDIKRLIGREFNDPVVQNDIPNWPFAVENGDFGLQITVEHKREKKTFFPEQISALVLSKMKEIAERYLNEKVTNAVITVPAYFNHEQRQATFDAATISGLNAIRIINEPTAAAIAFTENNHEFWRDRVVTNVLVFDLGGGTFDVTILSVDNCYVDVRATNGDTHLGGGDFDCRLVDFCIDKFHQKHMINVRGNGRAVQRLRSACERAKRELSSTTNTNVFVDALVDGIDLSITMTRAKFDQLNADLFAQTLEPVRKALSDANMDKKDIHEIVLVGGSTRIVKIQRLLKEFFDGKELNCTIDPDEAVAYGAAIQAAVLNGNNSEKIFGRLLKDVTPLSLGVGTKESFRVMNFMIPRNTTIPVSISSEFTSFSDNQTCASFPVRQGESSNALDNFLLGKFELTGFPIGPKGEPKIDVTFAIDVNGILSVTARDKATGTTNGIKIENISGRLKKQQIEKMIAEAEKLRTDEAKRQNAIQARNKLEQKCYDIQSALLDDVEDVAKEERSAYLAKCNDILDWLQEHPNESEETFNDQLNTFKSLGKSLLSKIKNIFSVD